MTRPPTPSPRSAVREPQHAVQVVDGASAGTGAHVRSLTEGLVARGLRVTVCAPPGAEAVYGFTGAGARFAPLPACSEPEAAAVLRRLCADADLVHAHGVRAGLLAVTTLALSGRARRVPLVVTWHHRGSASGARAQLRQLMERRVARGASVVLAVTTDLVDRARRRGARDARLAPVVLPGPARHESPPEPLAAVESRAGHKSRAEVGAVGRPLVFSVGRLDDRHGYVTALSAARAWRHMDPPPLLAIAGEGPRRPELQRRIDDEELPVRLLGRREDAFELLAGADVALLCSRWESRPLLAQEALHEGVPLVATSVGGVPELVGDAAELIPYGDSHAIASAVGGLLADTGRRVRLVERGRARAADWPTEESTVAHVLSVYDELTGSGRS
ncbi:glycosyltransferase family 4 protein [Streptomyces sp. WMMB 322]|uniref:glycosyltransferase family 4 protein n=1 Tax=Streptomyces sp. WMMB 322 TaxID=1286821 RepID=UPI0006E3D4D2|nr:glycosyltransferase family 4 protein [Streptomyces sp. WMMB 322]SCK53120.1 Glycosyltransferase involved in cell wall bisynthesis [Streptomyces sp. WMMB 322]